MSLATLWACLPYSSGVQHQRQGVWQRRAVLCAGQALNPHLDLLAEHVCLCVGEVAEAWQRRHQTVLSHLRGGGTTEGGLPAL